jgi:hypothetical protein
MPHSHTWRVTQTLLLSLPTRDGFAERFTAWRCATCPEVCTITGEIRVGTPLQTPPFWDAVGAQEAQRQTAEAREARRQMQRRVA